MAEIIKAASPNLVRKESYLAMLDAVTILDTAREQGRHLLEEARAQGNEIRAIAREAGAAEGLRYYLAEAAKLDAAITAFYSKTEPDLVRLALAIARKLLGAELEARPEAVAQIVRDALAGVRQARRVIITVHVSQTATLQAQIHTLELSASCEVRVVGSADTDPAGCLIDTDFGIIDARLETRMATIERALLGAPRPA